jgi:hypothetical protein
MWSMANDEANDPWVPYAWKVGEVSLFRVQAWLKANNKDEEAVNKALGKLIIPADRRDRLECKTRPLDYLDNPRNRDDLFKR